MANFFKQYIIKNPIFYMILTTLICLALDVAINLGFSYLYIFLIDKYLESYYYLKYILIPILFIYNYLLIRKILITWLFEWQYPYQIFSIYKERQPYISFLKERITFFLNAIDVLLDVQYQLTENEINEIEYFFDIFNEEFYIYDNLYNIVHANNGINNNNLIRYKMSQCQVNYYNLLQNVNNIFNQNNFGDKLRNIRSNKELINSMRFTKENDLEQSLSSLKLQINEILALIEKYSAENYTYMSPAYVFNLLFNDTFGSLSLYSIRFKKNFQEYDLEENYSPNGKIHYTLILCNNNNQNNNNNNNEIKIEEKNDIIKENTNLINDRDYGTLLFFCLPNGGCYELIPKSKIKFYLNNGFSFLCWNYRGYGHSKGSANFSNCRSDALEVFDTITKNNKYNFKKVCVMGHSIGGVGTSHLSRNRKVDLVISDRNFCDIPRIVLNFHCGSVLSFLVKFLLIGNTNIIEDYFNNDNFIKENRINRIIIYSPNDSLIDNDCTVKSGISRYIIQKYVFYKKEENNIIKNKDNFLDIVFNSTEKSFFLENLINLIRINKNFALNFKNNESQMNKENDIAFSFLDKFYGICCDNLIYITENNNNMSMRRQKLFLDSFFNNLLIWGVQDTSEQNEDLYDFEFFADKGIQIMKEACDVLNEVSDIDEKILVQNKQSSLLQNLKRDFKKIFNVMEKLDIALNINDTVKRVSLRLSNINNPNVKETLLISEEEDTDMNTNINTNSKYELNNNLIEDSNEKLIVEDNFYKKLNEILGNFKLFKTNVGHNGSLRDDEKEKFFVFLLRSGVIN